MMVEESPSSMAAQQPLVRSLPDKKKVEKVPKKENKAKREKQKRDHMNDLFLELGDVLEPARQNNGKASILVDATRLLQALIARVECLKKENAALVTESNYVMVEKNELQDEKTVLASEVERLQNELSRKQSDTESAWHKGVEVASPIQPQPINTVMPMQQPPVGALFVVPVPQELHLHPGTETAPAAPEPSSEVRRPHARYPSASDSWPLELLSRTQKEAHEAHQNGS